jgi:iron complex outermembrane receptor protein
MVSSPPIAKRAAAGARLLLFPVALSVAGVLRAADPDLSVDALKQLSVEQLMDLDVTSVTRYPAKLLDAPSAIQVVTGDEIIRYGATSLPEALQLADNLEVAQKNSHDWAIGARGFNTALDNKLLVMIDGRTVYSPLFSGVFWDVQDVLLADLDRIEVVSGPGGALWGANAVNGVINITTKGAQATPGLYVESGGGGPELRDFTAARYGGTLAPGVYFRVYGKYTDRGDELTDAGSKADDSWSQDRGGFRLDAGTDGPDTVTLQGDFYHGDENVETGGTAQVSGGNILGRWSHRSPDDSTTSLQAYYDRTTLDDPIPALALGALKLAPAGILTDGLDTYDLDFQRHFALGDANRWVWGLGYRQTRDALVGAPALTFLPSILDQNLFSAFAQDEIALAPAVFLTVGTKVEHNDYTGVELEPNVRLRWNPTPKQMLWTAVSRAVRAPSRTDRDLREAAPPDFLLLEGSSAFVSEKVIAYELGYRAELDAKAAASLSAFYNDYTDVRSTSFTPATVVPLFFANNLEGETHGLEFSGSYQALPGWQLRAGYDLLLENIGVKPGATDINDAHNETADPEHQFSVTSSLDLPGSVTLDVRLRWVGALVINSGATLGTVPSYHELNVRLAWRPVSRLELSLVGQNLLHASHPEYGFPGPGQEEIQRNLYGEAVWRY